MKADMEVDVGRLWDSWKKARLALRIFRENRRDAVRQFVGKHYSDDGATKEVPVNLLALWAGIVNRNLIARNPRVLMSTFDAKMKPTISAMEDWTNHKMKQMGFAATMARIALDAMFSIGIGKVALASPADAAAGSYSHPAGEAFFSSIDLDDMAWDTHARNLDEVSWVGHRYRAPIDLIRDSKIFSQERKKVEPTPDNPYNLEGDEKVKMIARGYWADSDEYEDYGELYEIYLPRRRLIVTIAEGIEDPLRVQRWIGPKKGPYHFLCLGIVPGNQFPKAPVMDLIDLHDLENRTWRKLARQSDRQKSLLLVSGGADEDGKRINDASDGDAVRADNPERAQERRLGGVDNQQLGFAIQTKDTFGYVAGNLDMMGGLSPQSNTLGQDEMLAKNASRQVLDLQDRTVGYTQTVTEALAWFWWHDPYSTHRSVFSLPGAPDLSIERRVTPADREKMPFEDIDLQIDPYSLTAQTPQGRIGVIQQIIQQVIIPGMQMFKEQGIALDLNRYLEIMAKYSNLPELQEIITFSKQPQEQSQTEKEPGDPDYTSTAPAQKNTTTERISNTTGGSRQGQDVVQQLMAAGGNGDGEQKLPRAMRGVM